MIRNLLHEFVAYIRDPSPVLDQAARAISDELQFHLEQSVHDGIDSGLSPQEAREQALSRFGSVEGAFRDCTQGVVEGHDRFHRVHLAITALLLVVVAVLGTWLLTRPTADRENLLLSGDIRGRVLDENSAPIEGAHILAVIKIWPEGGFQQKAHTVVTKRDGTFLVADVYPEHDDYEVQIAVLAAGRVMESSYFSRQYGPLPPTEFQLGPSAPLAVRFEGDDGVPLHDVEVFPFQRIAEGGVEETVYFCSAKPIVRRSTATGEVSLPYFAPGDNATVYLKAPGGDWKTHDFAVSQPQQVVVIKMGKQPAGSKLASATNSRE